LFSPRFRLRPPSKVTHIWPSAILSYDPATAAQTESLNAPIIAATLAFGGKVASGFGAFQGPALAAGGSSCAAGLLIVLAPGVCDVHPTPLGRDLLAGAVVHALAHS